MSEAGIEDIQPTNKTEISHKDIVEVVENDRVLEKFKQGEIIARVLDSPRTTRGVDGFELDMGMWGDALKYLTNDEGKYLSSTLIMEGSKIPLFLYNSGLLFDSEKVKIEHISTTDSVSRGSTPESFVATNANFKTLDELRDYYQKREGMQEMNEINISANLEALLGFVINIETKSPLSLANFEVVKKHFQDNGINLPAYTYDHRSGTITRYIEPDKSQLIAAMNPVFQSIYEKAM